MVCIQRHSQLADKSRTDSVRCPAHCSCIWGPLLRAVTADGGVDFLQAARGDSLMGVLAQATRSAWLARAAPGSQAASAAAFGQSSFSAVRDRQRVSRTRICSPNQEQLADEDCKP